MKIQTAMQAALEEAGINRPQHFRKFKGRVRRRSYSPAVIETSQRSKNGRMIGDRKRVQRIAGFGVVNGENVAITVSGDVWNYTSQGNNYFKGF